MTASRQPIKPFGDERPESVGACGFGALINDRFVDEVGIEQGAGD